jgi:hypothetical protein
VERLVGAPWLYSPECLERLSEKGMSNTPTVNLGGVRRPKWREEHLLSRPQGHAVAASGAFRTVSEGVFSEVRQV